MSIKRRGVPVGEIYSDEIYELNNTISYLEKQIQKYIDGDKSINHNQHKNNIYISSSLRLRLVYMYTLLHSVGYKTEHYRRKMIVV